MNSSIHPQNGSKNGGLSKLENLITGLVLIPGKGHIFCAFKCRYNITKEQLERIEGEVLKALDQRYTDDDGATKRMSHFESKRSSECYNDIDFMDFFINLHEELYNNHSNYFLITGLENEYGDDMGEFLDCEFNSRISIKEAYRLRLKLTR